MCRAVLADLHLGQGTGDFQRFEALTRWLAEQAPTEIIFVGDVFRALVGFPRFWTQEIRRALEALAALRERGIRVIWVEGNRDFFLEHRAMDPYRDRWVMAYGFACGGRRFLVEHGDLINRQDRLYRFWRRISKSRLTFWGAQLLPRPLALALMSNTERTLAQTNFTYRRGLPEEELRRAARDHFAAGVDVVLWGHFHKPWSFREGGKEAHVVPGWIDEGTVWVVDENGQLAVANLLTAGGVSATTLS